MPKIKPWGLTHRTEKDAELANLKDREKLQNIYLEKYFPQKETNDKRVLKRPKWFHDYEAEAKKTIKSCRHCEHLLSDHSLEVTKYFDRCNIKNCKCTYFLEKL